MRRLLAAALLLSAAAPAYAHEWYAKRTDPDYNNGCCGGSDCKELDGGLVQSEADGFRIRLTLEQAKAVNPEAWTGIDALVPWSRVQESEDGNYHICIFTSDRTGPRGGVICLFAPPAS